MLDIHHSGWELSNCFPFFVRFLLVIMIPVANVPIASSLLWQMPVWLDHYLLLTRALVLESSSHRVCLFVGCLTSQQQASVSQGRIYSDNFTCCHTEIQVADQTFYPTQAQYTDTGPTRPSADPITPGTWQGSHWSVNFRSLV